MELDGEISVAGVQWDISTGPETYIGFGPDTHMKCTYLVVFNLNLATDRINRVRINRVQPYQIGTRPVEN